MTPQIILFFTLAIYITELSKLVRQNKCFSVSMWRSEVNALYHLYYSSTFKKIPLFIYVFICVHVHICLGTHVEVRGQSAGIGSLHHVASKNQTQTLCQAPLPTEPSHWPSSLCLRPGLWSWTPLTELYWLTSKLQVPSVSALPALGLQTSLYPTLCDHWGCKSSPHVSVTSTSAIESSPQLHLLGIFA